MRWPKVLLVVVLSAGLGEAALAIPDFEPELHKAAQRGWIALVKNLSSRERVREKNSEGSTPLHALMRGIYRPENAVEIAKILLDNGAEVDARDNGGLTPLAELLINYKTEDLKLVAFLIERGADVRSRDKQEWPILAIAVNYSQDPNLINLLVANGASKDLSFVDKSGATLCQIAALSRYGGGAEICTLLTQLLLTSISCT